MLRTDEDNQVSVIAKIWKDEAYTNDWKLRTLLTRLREFQRKICSQTDKGGTDEGGGTDVGGKDVAGTDVVGKDVVGIDAEGRDVDVVLTEALSSAGL